MRIYIDVEIKNRDLWSRLLLAALLVDRGHTCFIGQAQTIHCLRALGGVDIVIKKSVRKRNLPLLFDLADDGVMVANLPEEGFLIDNPDRFILQEMPTDCLDFVSVQMLPGRYQKNLIKQLRGDAKCRLEATGNPRVDVWRNRYFGLFDDVADSIRARFGEFVLINLNFPAATNYEQLKTELSLSDYLDREEGLRDFARWVSASESLYCSFLSLASELVKNGHRVIVRPHPGDQLDRVRADFEAVEGVNVEDSHCVAPWLMACSAMVHNCCGTAIEAVLMDVKVISYSPDGLDQYLKAEVNELGQRAFSNSEVLKCLSTTEISRGIDLDCFDLGGCLDMAPGAAQRVLAAIESLNRPGLGSANVLYQGLPAITDKLFCLAASFKTVLIRLKTAKANFRYHKKFPDTGNEEIEKYLGLLFSKGIINIQQRSQRLRRNVFRLGNS